MRSETKPSPGRLRLALLLAAVAAALLLVPTARALAAEASLEVEITGSGLGTVSCEVEGGPVEECEAQYEEGTELTLVAEAEAGSEFAEWSGLPCEEGTEPTCTLTIDEDISIEAVFELEEFELSVQTEGQGEGIVECQVNGGPYEPCPEGETYPYETQVTLFAEPEAGSEFLQWGGDCAGIEAECQLTVEEALSVSAVFVPEPPFELTVLTAGSGTGSVSCEVQGEECEAGAEYEEGTQIVLLATAKEGSEFASWSGCDSVTGNECEVEMNADRTVTASFKAKAKPEETCATNAALCPPPTPTPTPAPTPPAETKCVVPKLAKKSLGQAKSALKAAHCALGKVSKPKKAKGALVVKSSKPGAGTSLAAGAKVGLKLGPKPKKKKK
jgi:hypothetical protein